MKLRNRNKEPVVCDLCLYKLPTGVGECPNFSKAKDCALSPLVEDDEPVLSFRPEEIIADPKTAKFYADLTELPSTSPTQVYVPDGYADLFETLMNAFSQSATGKGRERHNRTGALPFNKQPIMEIGRMVGPGYASGQAMKKLQEALRLPRDRAIAECYGAIVYAAAMVLLLREQEQGK